MTHRIIILLRFSPFNRGIHQGTRTAQKQEFSTIHPLQFMTEKNGKRDSSALSTSIFACEIHSPDKPGRPVPPPIHPYTTEVASQVLSPPLHVLETAVSYVEFFNLWDLDLLTYRKDKPFLTASCDDRVSDITHFRPPSFWAICKLLRHRLAERRPEQSRAASCKSGFL